MDLEVQEELGDKPSYRPHRQRWMRRRLEQESQQARFRYLLKPHRIAGKAFEVVSMGLRHRFMRPLTEPAYRLEINELELGFSNLPAPFDGYRLLHLSDFHFDRLPGIERAAASLTSNLHVDLAVFTGDYQDRRSHRADHLEHKILRPLETLYRAIQTRDGVLATLGNHDSAHMVAPFESIGLQLLCNETVSIERNGQFIHVTGLDDVCRYYTPAARDALHEARQGFKIALVHSADIYEAAADNGYALQLSGHTHGGQICLPGRVPIFTNLRAGRRFASGVWRHGELTGITNRGVGAAGLPVRAFCPGEVLVLTLRKRAP